MIFLDFSSSRIYLLRKYYFLTSGELETGERSLEIDILRVAAIIGVVIAHLWLFVPNLYNEWFYHNLQIPWYAATIGVSTFVFLSGYSLMLSKPRFEKLGDLKRFFLKRFKVIFPIYWFTLFTVYISEAIYSQPLLFPDLMHINALVWISYITGSRWCS